MNPTEQSYENLFGERGLAYHSAMEISPGSRAAEFELVMSKIQPRDNDVLVDVPGGGGYLRQYLNRPALKYIAVEMTKDFADHCPTGPNDQVIRSPMAEIDLADAHADICVSVAASHHCMDKPAFFREVARILKPGGRFVLVDGEAGSKVERFLNGFVDEYNSLGHEGKFLTPGIVSQIEDCGFVLKETEVVDFPWAFPSREAMGVFCKLLFGIDQASETELVDEIERTLGLCEGPGEINLGWQLRVAVADRK